MGVVLDERIQVGAYDGEVQCSPATEKCPARPDYQEASSRPYREAGEHREAST